MEEASVLILWQFSSSFLCVLHPLTNDLQEAACKHYPTAGNRICDQSPTHLWRVCLNMFYLGIKKIVNHTLMSITNSFRYYHCSSLTFVACSYANFSDIHFSTILRKVISSLVITTHVGFSIQG